MPLAGARWGGGRATASSFFMGGGASNAPPPKPSPFALRSRTVTTGSGRGRPSDGLKRCASEWNERRSRAVGWWKGAWRCVFFLQWGGEEPTVKQILSMAKNFFAVRTRREARSGVAERCGRWLDRPKEGRWIERAGTAPASRVVRLRLGRHHQLGSRQGRSGGGGKAGPGHHRRRGLPRVQPVRDQWCRRDRRVPPVDPHLAGVPLRGRRHLLLRRRAPAERRRQLPGRAVRGRAGVRG